MTILLCPDYKYELSLLFHIKHRSYWIPPPLQSLPYGGCLGITHIGTQHIALQSRHKYCIRRRYRYSLRSLSNTGSRTLQLCQAGGSVDSRLCPNLKWRVGIGWWVFPCLFLHFSLPSCGGFCSVRCFSVECTSALDRFPHGRVLVSCHPDSGVSARYLMFDRFFLYRTVFT